MKFFKRESFIKKVIIAVVIVLLTNFSFPTMSRAADISEAIGDFLLMLPDGMMWMMQSLFLGDGDVKIKVSSGEKKDGEQIPLGKIAVKGISTGGIYTIYGAIYNIFIADGDYNLPHITYTPYNIFANNIPLLNADFFGKETENTKKVFYCENLTYGRDSYTIPEYYADSRQEVKEYIKKQYEKNNNQNDMLSYSWDKEIQNYYANPSKNKDRINSLFDKWLEAGAINVADAYKPKQNEKFSDVLDDVKDDYQSQTDYYNEIFLNIYPEKAPKDSSVTSDSAELEELYAQIKEEDNSVISSVSVLKPVVSKWYNILRTVAMVGLLSVLVYIGIRILIYSTSAQDKAKYKTMLKDWLVGLCLLFVLHFVMSFTMAATRYIGDVFKGSDVENVGCIIYNDTKCEEDDAKSKINFDKHIYKEDGDTYWKCNAVERIRYNICMTMQEETISMRIAYTIMYIVIVIEVLIFTFQYLKRVITMAMLTLIAPLVALTYPIDKITDGKAQGFNMWLKEYIFNALLQPMHLILYTIIMSSAFALVASNPIYSIVALGCMAPMEKLLRKIFGFGKAESVGAFGGAAGAAVVMSTIGSLQKLGKKPPMGKGKEKDDGLKLWDNKKSIDSEGLLFGAPDLGGQSPDNSNGGLSPNGNSGTASKYKVKVGPANAGTTSKMNAKAMPPNGKAVIPNIPLSAQKTNMPTTNKSGATPKHKVKVKPANLGTASKMNAKAMANQKAIANKKATTLKTPTSAPIRTVPTASNTNRNATQTRAIKNPRLYALGQVGRAYGKKLTRDLSPTKVIRNVAKVATGAAVGGALGTVGLAAGIASGDLGKAVQYTTTAGVAGATLGSSFADRRADNVENIKDTYETAYASVDKDYATNKRIKEFMKNEQNMQYLESRYVDKQERDEVINTMKQAAEYGITNVQDVSAIHEMRKKEGLGIDQAIALAKMSKKTGDISQPKARKDWKEHFESKGYSDEQVKQVLNRLEKYQKERD